MVYREKEREIQSAARVYSYAVRARVRVHLLCESCVFDERRREREREYAEVLCGLYGADQFLRVRI